MEKDALDDAMTRRAKDHADQVIAEFFRKPRAKSEWDKISLVNDKV